MPLLGQISIFPFAPPPTEWAPCDGSQVRIADNPALFGVIGTNFGGDGTTCFNLPDLRGRTPVGNSADDWIGASGGIAGVTLDKATMPMHGHGFNAVAGPADSSSSAGAMFAQPMDGNGNPIAVYAPAATMVTLAGPSITPAGSGTPHDNMQPYLATGCYIAITGPFPMRSGG